MSKIRPLIRLIMDFDGTLTRKDTLHLVAQAGYDRQRQKTVSRTTPPWQEIVEAYMADFEHHQQTYKLDNESRTTLQAESAWLNSLKPVEIASAQRVYKAGILDDVTKEDIFFAAQKAFAQGELQLRSGWSDLLNHVLKLNRQTNMHTDQIETLQIVSVNWSRHFISSILKIAAESLQYSDSSVLNQIFIYANEIPSITQQVPRQTEIHQQPRGQIRDLRTSEDKLKLMNESIEKYKALDMTCLNVYIGDSTTDLECLLSSDVGICVRDDPMGSSQVELSDAFDRLKIPVMHVSEFSKLSSTQTTTSRHHSSQHILWCTDLHQITGWLANFSP